MAFVSGSLPGGERREALVHRRSRRTSALPTEHDWEVGVEECECLADDRVVQARRATILFVFRSGELMIASAPDDEPAARRPEVYRRGCSGQG
jgi:hypothetical protein